MENKWGALHSFQKISDIPYVSLCYEKASHLKFTFMEIIQSSIVILDYLPKIVNKTFPIKTNSRKWIFHGTRENNSYYP